MDISKESYNLELIYNEIKKAINWNGSGQYYLPNMVQIMDYWDHSHLTSANVLNRVKTYIDSNSKSTYL